MDCMPKQNELRSIAPAEHAEEAAVIKFNKSTAMAWQLIAREHERAVSEFFLAVMEEQGLSPDDWTPNVSKGIMAFERIKRG